MRQRQEVKPEINLRYVNQLRKGNPYAEELKSYYNKRDEYFAFARKKGIFIRDFLVFSPMYICHKWTKESNESY